MKLGIIGAMPEEVAIISSLLDDVKSTLLGGRKFQRGYYKNIEVIVVFSRWGKVAASTTAATLINTFGVEAILFTGVAGAVDERLAIGDIVIGNNCIQHDMDASPLFPKYQIPLTQNTYFAACPQLTRKINDSVDLFIKQDLKIKLTESIRKEFNIVNPKSYFGTIASGDQFINCKKKLHNLKIDIQNILAVEMEGAAVAQVCDEHDLPFTIIRIISDKADDNAPIDFKKFIEKVASFYCFGIIKHFLDAEASSLLPSEDLLELTNDLGQGNT